MKKKSGVLSELKANPNNPRSIGDWEADALKRALNEFGDLGGVVRNIRTDQLVGGHQRVNQFRSLGNAKVVIKQRFKKPTKRGTIAMGYVEMDGEQFSYREVDWTPAREAAANVAANKHGGEFDWEALSSVLKSVDQADIDLLGFQKHELDNLLAAEWSTPPKEEFPTMDEGRDIITLTPEARELFDRVKEELDQPDDLQALVELCKKIAGVGV